MALIVADEKVDQPIPRTTSILLPANNHRCCCCISRRRFGRPSPPNCRQHMPRGFALARQAYVPYIAAARVLLVQADLLASYTSSPVGRPAGRPAASAATTPPPDVTVRPLARQRPFARPNAGRTADRLTETGDDATGSPSGFSIASRLAPPRESGCS